ncbi:MAG: FtsH protease activity modulator HflK [Planctomycetes bacterium]|nr:FtsH protease activity modulator HflK [Planctomycetota bacterium]
MFDARQFRRQAPDISVGHAIAAFVAVAAVLIVLSGAWSCFYTVPADSEAVVLRFGRYKSTQPPGLHFKLPFGIDRANIVAVRKVETEEFGRETLVAGTRTQYRRRDEEISLMLTGDLNCAVVEWIVQYRIKNSRDYLYKVKDVPDTIRDASESVIRRLVGDRSVDEVITSGREELGAEAENQLQKLLDEYECGIDVVALKLQNATPPEAVKDAFENVNRAKQLKDKVINEAEAQRNKEIPAARGKRDGLINEAEGYKQKLIKEATGETAAFLKQLAEYKKAPEITKARLFLETMEEIFSKSGKKTIVDKELKGIVPLLQLRAKGGAK